MAIVVADYSWKQTHDCVVVRVPLKGVPPSKVDITTHDTYIKAHFKPFLFEAFLLNMVEDASSQCTISDEEIIFTLEKYEKGIHWDALCPQLSREDKNKRRESVLNEIQQRIQNENVRKKDVLQKLQKTAVQHQIELENTEKKSIDEIRNTERTRAMEDFENWKTSQDCHTKGERKLGTHTGHSDKDSSSSEDDLENHHVWSATHTTKPVVSSVELTEADLCPVPFTRKDGLIRVSFTPRAFPTPKRESQDEEEQTWLKKQMEARRKVGFVEEDLRPQECDPQWLKEKGDSFFKVGNYLGAISAYSHGIKISNKMASLYVNRSAAHFALGNLQRVIEDCSSALELMVPAVRLNEDSRARCHARRGAALSQIGMLQAGLADLEAALAIRPQDKKLQQDTDQIRKRIKESSSN